MDIDQYLLWLSDAIKASASDENSIDEKLLTKNIKDCYTRVKSACKSTSNKTIPFEDFRLRSTLALLISTECISSLQEIQCNREFQAVITTFPTISVTDFFTVIRSQKNYKFLCECLNWIPVSVLCKIIQEFFINTSDVTPVTLAIATELRKSMLFRLQHETSEFNIAEIKETMDVFMKTSYHISGTSKDLIKLGGYYFMYLTDSALFLLKAILGKEIEESLLCSTTEVWKKVWFNDLEKAKPITFLADSLLSILKLNQNCLDAVTVNVWTEWCEFDLPLTHPSYRITQYQGKTRTLQSAICYNAFDFLRIWDTDLSLIRNLLSEISQNIESIEGILSFFRSVSSDPDHDPDIDLDEEELISQISLGDDRQGKLLGILLNQIDTFDNDKSLTMVKDNIASVDHKARENLLIHFIGQARERKPFKDGWLQVVLDLASGISVDRLLVVISEHLSHGQDDMLKSSEFNSQMTAVFNQLAGDTAAVNSGRHIWLCLQSGMLVVDQAVHLAVSLPGLVPVMIQALSAIKGICRAVTARGISQLVYTLETSLKKGLVGREIKDFTALVTGLMTNDTLDPREVYNILVIPYLTISEGKLDKLSLPLGLLLTLTEAHIEVLSQPDVEIVAIIITIIYILDGTTYLQGPTAQKILDLRIMALKGLGAYTDAILKDKQNYQREISLLKQLVVTLDVHPNSIVPVLQILDKEEIELLDFDNLTEFLLVKLNCQNNSESGNKYIKKEDFGDLKKDFTGNICDEANVVDLLENVSSEQWLWAMLQILPHRSEDEWIRSISVTHKYLSPDLSPYPVLHFYGTLLYLLCTQVVPDDAEEDNIIVASVSIQHAFKSFAVAASVYIEEITKSLSFEHKFQKTCEVFNWWCSTVIKYECNADLPALFLMRLTSIIEKWIQEKKILLVDNNNKTSAGLIEQKEQAHKMHSYINYEDFQRDIFKMVSSLVKFIPQCNVSASVASKLNKLYQLNVE